MIRRTFLGGLVSLLGLSQVANSNQEDTNEKLLKEISGYLKSINSDIYDKNRVGIIPRDMYRGALFHSYHWNIRPETYKINIAKLGSLQNFIDKCNELYKNCDINLTADGALVFDITGHGVYAYYDKSSNEIEICTYITEAKYIGIRELLKNIKTETVLCKNDYVEHKRIIYPPIDYIKCSF